MRKLVQLSLLTFACSLVAVAQSFSSGSTGADGALDLTSGDRSVQLPDSGILNYTTVNIPAGRTLTFGLNLRNTPVVMLVQGAVTIAGTIQISGHGRTPGPGGFYGGSAGQDGFGPGAGQIAGTTTNGSWIGPLSLVPIIGGSGGAGVTACSSFGGQTGGGGGGGAVVVASSLSINISGNIFANGEVGQLGCNYAFWGNGAQGSIRLGEPDEFSGQIVRCRVP